MVDAVAAKEQKKALDYYYDLLTLKEPPMRILYLLTRQFRILMEVKEMDRTGVPPKEIAAKVGIMPFLVGKYRAQAKAFTRKELRGSRCTDGRRCKNRKDGRYPLGGTLSGAVQ